MSEGVSRETDWVLPDNRNLRWVTDRGLRVQAGLATLSLFQVLLEQNLPEVEELVPADDSLLIVLRPGARVSLTLSALLSSQQNGQPANAVHLPGREHLVPVRFDGEDLPTTAELAAMPVEQVVGCLLALKLSVHFLGFQPGFAYLTGLPSVLCVPRLASPRKQVPAGSVALGGGYCGIYPAAGPGGWHLIGRTEVCLFDPFAAPPARFQPGDMVRFVLA